MKSHNEEKSIKVLVQDYEQMSLFRQKVDEAIAQCLFQYHLSHAKIGRDSMPPTPEDLLQYFNESASQHDVKLFKNVTTLILLKEQLRKVWPEPPAEDRGPEDWFVLMDASVINGFRGLMKAVAFITQRHPHEQDQVGPANLPLFGGLKKHIASLSREERDSAYRDPSVGLLPFLLDTTKVRSLYWFHVFERCFTIPYNVTALIAKHEHMRAHMVPIYQPVQSHAPLLHEKGVLNSQEYDEVQACISSFELVGELGDSWVNLPSAADQQAQETAKKQAKIACDQHKTEQMQRQLEQQQADIARRLAELREPKQASKVQVKPEGAIALPPVITEAVRPVTNCLVNFKQLKELQQIGEGQYATVDSVTWAHPCGENYRVALKKYKDQSGGTVEKQVAMEIQVLTTYRHPNIIDFYGTLTSSQYGSKVIVLPLAHCAMDTFILNRHNVVPMERMQQWVGQLGSALDYLHTSQSVPMLYADFKLANILIMPQGQVVISDFGLSIAQNDEDNSHYRGTPVYSAPEVFVERKVTTASDIFSYAMLVCAMLRRAEPNKVYQSIVPRGKRMSEIIEILKKAGEEQSVDMNKVFPVPDQFNTGGGEMAPVPAATKRVLEQCRLFSVADRPSAREIHEILSEKNRGTIEKNQNSLPGEPENRLLI